jgi:hypothetical protein
MAVTVAETGDYSHRLKKQTPVEAIGVSRAFRVHATFIWFVRRLATPRESVNLDSWPRSSGHELGERPMIKKFANALMALTMVAAMTFAVAPQAEAGGRGVGVGVGVAAGIIGLGILGAAAGAHDYYGPRYYSRYDDGCFRGPRECHWSHRRCFENEYGDTVCRGGRYICDRPLVCD